MQRGYKCISLAALSDEDAEIASKMTTPKQKYIREHRLVLAKSLGRPLRNSEHVHHKYHNKTDNRPENLELMDASIPVDGIA